MTLDHLDSGGERGVCWAGTEFINTEPKAIGAEVPRTASP